jgi:hypothetical protein
LGFAPQWRIQKGNVFRQQKSGGKSDGEDKNKSRDVGTNGYKTQVNDLLVENKIVKNKIQKNVKRRVESSSGGVAKCFRRNKLPERRIKPTDGPDY